MTHTSLNREVSLSQGVDLDAIEACAQSWAHRLRVADWEIEIVVCRRFRVHQEKSADCHYFTDSKRATIHLAHPDDSAGGDEYSRDALLEGYGRWPVSLIAEDTEST